MDFLPIKNEHTTQLENVTNHSLSLSPDIKKMLNLNENFLDENRNLTTEYSRDNEFLEIFFYKELNKDGDLSENTLKAYRYDAQSLFQFLQLVGKSLKEIAYPEVEAYNLWTKEQFSVRTARRKLEFLRRMLVFGKKTNFYPENWAEYISKPKLKKGHYNYENPKEEKGNKRRKIVLREMEQSEAKIIADIFSSIPIKKKKFQSIVVARNKLIGAILYGTGMRASEICNLDFSSIRAKKDSLYLDIIGGKGNKDRTVPIMENLKDVLAEYVQVLKNELGYTEDFLLDKPLLFSPYGLDNGVEIKRMSYDNLYKIVKKAVLTAEKNSDISPHWFRHSYVTMMLENDVPLAIVKDLVGHADISTTNIYLDKIKEDKKHEHLSGLNHLGL